jgi:lactaldehyde dehydrogenase/glycolaldehyde dehydrogenase
MPAVDILNSATKETVATIPDADEAVVAEALPAAQSAQSAWDATPGVERAALIREIGSVIEDHVEDIGDILMSEQGKPKSAAEGEVAGTITLADYAAGWCCSTKRSSTTAASR